MKILKEIKMNPVSKARKITESLTEDVRLQNKLLEILTRALTAEQINKIYENTRN